MLESQPHLRHATIVTKKPRNRRKQKPKVPGSLIEYGAPDCKVIVRLLPPTLEQAEFLEQVEINSSTFRTKVQAMTYKTGSHTVQQFGEPDASIASFKFSSREAAEGFKSEIGKISFNEPRTGDKMRCKAINPIIGEFCALSPSDDYTIENDIFTLFYDRRTTDGCADILEVLSMVKAISKQKKKRKKSKSHKKLQNKSMGPVSNGNENATTEGDSNQRFNQTKKVSGNLTRSYASIQGNSRSNNRVEAKNKKNTTKKSNSLEQASVPKATLEETPSSVVSKSKSQKRKQKFRAKV